MVNFRDNQVLNDDQSKWIDKTQDKVHALIKETPPDGDKFSKTVRHILNREKQWNAWKNAGCPALVDKPIKDQKPKEAAPAVNGNSESRPQNLDKVTIFQRDIDF